MLGEENKNSDLQIPIIMSLRKKKPMNLLLNLFQDHVAMGKDQKQPKCPSMGKWLKLNVVTWNVLKLYYLVQGAK